MEYSDDMMGWMAPYDSSRDYFKVCRRAVQDDMAFATFRHNREYCVVLEHVSPDEGSGYLKAAQAIDADFVAKHFRFFQENDNVGGATLVRYPIGSIAPSTLRYVYVLTNLQQWVGSLGGLDIVEIGGGYGGLCRMAMAVCKPHSYTIFDLEAPLLLTRKYLSYYELSGVHLRQANDFDGMGNVDVVISTWALSELEQGAQQDYYTNLIGGSRFGYMAYNADPTPLVDCLKSLDRFEVVVKAIPGSTFEVKWRDVEGSPARFLDYLNTEKENEK